MNFEAVKDSGARQEFETGSVRDSRTGKGRFDLLSPIFLRRLAKHCENGAVKYGDRNWEKGQPLSRYLDSGCRHWLALLDGQTDEDHAAAWAWNAMAFIHTAEKVRQGELPQTLDDIGYTDETQIDSLPSSLGSPDPVHAPRPMVDAVAGKADWMLGGLSSEPATNCG